MKRMNISLLKEVAIITVILVSFLAGYHISQVFSLSNQPYPMDDNSDKIIMPVCGGDGIYYNTYEHATGTYYIMCTKVPEYLEEAARQMRRSSTYKRSTKVFKT